jgi:uncharacterized NAD(P)/FAD-binding protein YdhS
MNFNLTIIGFGVIGVETLFALASKIKKNQKFNIAVIEQNLNNIPGGVAYSKTSSKFGFFNNPLRLSHPSFKSWINKKENIKKIISFIKKNSNYQLNKWLKINLNDLMKKYISKEIYLPRLVYSFYLEEKIIQTIKLLKKKNIKVFYFQGNLDKVDFKKDYLILNPKSNFTTFKIYSPKKTLKIFKTKIKLKILKSEKIIIGNGLLPPKKIHSSKSSSNNNYIWDFYAEGGTNNLLQKINLVKKKKIILTFIGNKAGLLETMLQLKRLLSEKKIDIRIVVISQKAATLNKAEFSKNFKNFKLSFFNNKKIKNITKANEILALVKKEFKKAVLKKFNKYDVWTTILKKNILIKSLSRLNDHEKKKYNLFIFPKIRNITRFTFSETVSAKENLEKNNKIDLFKGKAISVKKFKNAIYIKTDKKKYLKSDIVINVSGPVNLDEINEESNFMKSVKNNTNKIDKRGFITDKKFMLTDQIFIPGVLAYNFNPSRQTIIKAITNNSYKVVNFLLNNISKK